MGSKFEESIPLVNLGNLRGLIPMLHVMFVPAELAEDLVEATQ